MGWWVVGRLTAIPLRAQPAAGVDPQPAAEDEEVGVTRIAAGHAEPVAGQPRPAVVRAAEHHDLGWLAGAVAHGGGAEAEVDPGLEADEVGEGVVVAVGVRRAHVAEAQHGGGWQEAPLPRAAARHTHSS